MQLQGHHAYKEKLQIEKEIRSMAEESKLNHQERFCQPVQAIGKRATVAYTKIMNEAFGFFCVVSQSAMDAQNVVTLDKYKIQVEKAIEIGDKKGMEGAVQVVQTMIDEFTREKEVADNVEFMASCLKKDLIPGNEAGYDNINELIGSMSKYLKQVGENHMYAMSVKEGMQVGWWKKNAETEYNHACNEYQQATIALGKIPLDGRFTDEVKSIRNTLPDAELLSQIWHQCQETADNYQEKAKVLEAATEKATAAKASADQVLILILGEDNGIKGVKSMDASIQDLIKRAEEIKGSVQELQVRVTKISTTNLEVENLGKIVNEAKHSAVEIHAICHEIDFRKVKSPAIGNAMDISLQVTQSVTTVLGSLAKNFTTWCQDFKECVEDQRKHASEAVENGVRELWQVSKNTACERMDLYDKCFELVEKTSYAAKETEDSFYKHKVALCLPEETIQAFSQIHRCALDARGYQKEARLALEAVPMRWYEAKARKENRRAGKTLAEAKTALGDITPPIERLQGEHATAKQAYCLALGSFKETARELSVCKGSEEEFDDIAAKFTSAYNKAAGAYKAAAAVQEIQKAVSGQKRKQPPLAEHTKKRIFPEKIHIIQMQEDADWRTLPPYPTPGSALEAADLKTINLRLIELGNSLLERGKLLQLSPDMGKLGSKTPEGFANSVQYSQNIFFLEPPDFVGDCSAFRLLAKAKECYFRCQKSTCGI
jgi:hypothetical protein